MTRPAPPQPTRPPTLRRPRGGGGGWRVELRFTTRPLLQSRLPEWPLQPRALAARPCPCWMGRQQAPSLSGPHSFKWNWTKEWQTFGERLQCFYCPFSFCIPLFFSIFFLSPSFHLPFFLCPSTFKHWEHSRENVYQALFFGGTARRSLAKPRTRNRSTKELGRRAAPPERGSLPPYPGRGLRKPFLSAGRLPFPFGGCLLCELMTVIITSLSSFVISNPQPERGGSGPFGEMEIFIKQIAV